MFLSITFMKPLFLKWCSTSKKPFLTAFKISSNGVDIVFFLSRIVVKQCNHQIMAKIIPISDHILIEPLKEEKKKSGIILPETVEKERQEKGRVIAVGPGRAKDGKRIPLEVKKGDMVLFSKYGPNEIKIDGKEYLVAKEDDILAIIN